MLTITLTARNKIFTMPSLDKGETGSITDTTDNTLVLFTCNANDSGATIERSEAGMHVDYDDMREIKSLSLQPIASVPRNGTFKLEIVLTIGPAVVEFEHVREH